MKRLLAFIVVTIVAVSIGIAIVGDYLDLGKQLAAEEEQKKELVSKLAPVLMDSLRSRIKVSLRIYKNGELVYYNPNDPITYHWMKLVSSILFGFFAFKKYHNPEIDLDIYLTDGTVMNGLEVEDVPWAAISTAQRIVIAVGNGTTPASPNDYKLENQIANVTLTSDNVVVNDTGTSLDIYFRYTFSFDTDVNVSESGLILCGAFVDTSIAAVEGCVLIARDTFTPISVSAGEAIAVEYAFSFDYSKPPFTKMFYKILANYLLGLRGVGLQFDDARFDFIVDCPAVDCVRDYLYFAYVLEPISWNPDITSVNVSELWLPRTWMLVCTETSVIVKGFLVQGDVGPVFTVYGIAFYLHTDADLSSGTSPVDVLVGIIPLDQPVTVDWSTGFYVEVGMSFA